MLPASRLGAITRPCTEDKPMSFPGTFQQTHACVAFPPERVTPRLTTAEALAERLAFADRAKPPSPPTSHTAEARGSLQHQSFDVVFHYADRPSVRFVAHGNALAG
jgi:hypothetical protein